MGDIIGGSSTIVTGIKNIFSGNIGGGITQITRGLGGAIGGNAGKALEIGSKALGATLAIANGSSGSVGTDITKSFGLEGDFGNFVSGAINKGVDAIKNGNKNNSPNNPTPSNINLPMITSNGGIVSEAQIKAYQDYMNSIFHNQGVQDVNKTIIKSASTSKKPSYRDNSGKNYYSASMRIRNGVDNDYTKTTDKLYLSALPNEVKTLKTDYGDEK